MCTIKNYIKGKDRSEKKTLIIGNGFSKCLAKKDFNWENLIADDKTLKETAKKLSTDNLEKMIEYLLIGKLIMPLLTLENNEKTKYTQEIENKIKGLKDLFKKNFKDKHPSTKIVFPNQSCCVSTLKLFDNIFTVNYDLILYWLISENLEYFADGFSNEICNKNFFSPFADYAQTNDKRAIYYLHGALHLFQDFELGGTYKVEYNKSKSESILDQIKNKNNVPLVILEGNSDDKIKQINENFYLKHSYDQLSKIKGDVYTFGISFEKDEHIIKQLSDNNKIKKIHYGSQEGKIPQHLENYKKLEAYNTKDYTFDSECNPGN